MNQSETAKLFIITESRPETRALIWGGGGGGRGGGIFIYSCSARLISFEMNLKTTNFKKKFVGQNANM